MLKLLWLIPALPFLSALFLGIFGRTLRLSERTISWIACGSVFLSLVISIGAVYEFATAYWPTHGRPYLSSEAGGFPHSFTWVVGGDARLSLGPDAGKTVPLRIEWSYQLDQLSAVMILIVTFVGFWIHVFSIGYMRGDRGFYRFFAQMNLFMFMMLVLVMSSNFLMMFVGWEGVGLCSYLLIGYYFHWNYAAYASKKAFIVNRVGDFGFLLAMFAIFSLFGTLQFTEVMELAKSEAYLPQEHFGMWGLASWIALGLFIGATGKSAQLPLYVWLPDAMAGPTPVSALIHAATMVTAGVYMVTRTNVIFQKSPTMMFVVALVGVLTAVWAASMGFTQTDIKKVLAYSTISQLGYMFLACGVGAFAAGIFHLYTHAFFKALMFLGAGSVIIALHHEMDMRRMGGLARFMPITYKTFLVGWLAICGIPLFSGFFSKDEILWRTFSTDVIPGGRWLWLLGFLGAGMTAFYMTRLIALTFWGEPRFVVAGGSGASHGHEEHGGHEVRESPRVMTIPLIVLAVGAFASGWIGWPKSLGGENHFEKWLEPVIWHRAAGSASPMAGHGGTSGVHAALAEAGAHAEAHSAIEYLLMLASVLLAVGVMYGCATLYLRRRDRLEAIVRAIRPLYVASANKYWVDEFYEGVFVNGLTLGLSRLSWRVDARGVDGGVNGSAWMTVFWSRISGWFDLYVVDFLVNAVGAMTKLFSTIFRMAQTGFAQNYALVITTGLFLLTALYLIISW
ncbi:MAG: NADH-quinone oxidoreductase subunit L [Blastocatellia bacterium]|nr:NADH-quinone oxidoreductase subunit L [Blastocatellia bacterium]MCS7157916.1 NADH-quinone oxidoreductase subunit L [Blastocatellia bacterium]MDW8168004.1 NADH-quinone oxidoreductase subunit L [Acidobacteriota bacterium]MDW8257043.1 NADH-quinone oxidoreductase subunit L [Acidobacteriota bacterium]